uniref:Bromo domain-containing protein n=1 Tax=Eucampia antarctica TaxID=49252 RepID=A0A7S2WIF9_9STRA|mmetsp:Transcript_3126/g.3011  ORF Transcript_3126/g.3011 Transcript_3126/m.3011 type:complete len:219 (+) Transcript_3126:194-850(+)|eukprot:CAMPEP_0197831316 /NCGR_PEP_ID=MMETSP1437-20131217/9209_1 /TAXON_ID=49252 ORGANISM="Eucampia antarctica, Strain CCMP1452" /NCGR_SAMPLE_ID=MMETSP1437 /ASSEMBLY_ACC=CAM_ASM_001096 /LENGTH=218 /DNA_ID=CAMNT_0043434175 /DNA_START=194 /DNA_END=850 /DNA_ORIENTATION=-
MPTQSQDWSLLSKLLGHFYAKADAEPFREAVDWKGLGLFDYPQIIKKPMDLGQVKRNIETSKYKTIHEAAEDVRLIWKNCMTYNADGSDFYILAQNMSKKFEDKFSKLLKDVNVSDTDGKAKSSEEPTLEEKRGFAKGLYKISKEELGRVITDLDSKCPAALTKNSAEDEVEINVDQITPAVFHEVIGFVQGCIGDGGTGRKKKAASGNKPSKKSRSS